MHKVMREYLKISVPREFDWLVIGGCDADLLPACMVLGRIQDQKQKYNLEWPKFNVCQDAVTEQRQEQNKGGFIALLTVST